MKRGDEGGDRAPKPGEGGTKAAAEAARQAKLAAALRANLRRRKAGARAPVSGGDTGESES
ncbi:MAG TPA: hypothetical protein VG939_09560 [Caulobacteraceae bacterium]|nr:hypothetical protein [Caulobacteraceae bacterium]